MSIFHLNKTLIPGIFICFGFVFMADRCALNAQSLDPEAIRKVESAIDSIDPPLPLNEPLFPYHLRDVAVCRGPDHSYYLTGTTDDNWGVADGIRVWKSHDLKKWQMIGRDGFVWTFDRDASNEQQREIVIKNNRLMRGIWAPEIHYLNDNFWITYSISNGYGSGLLRSTTGKPEGPYEDVSRDKSIVNGIDATLFEDNDGTVWYIWGPGKMKKMRKDMTGFEDNSEPLFPKDAAGKEVGYEGVNMYKKNGIYYLMAAEWNSEGPGRGHLMRNTNMNRRAADGRYDCMIAMSEKLTGPYTKAYIAIPHGGHNMIFDDYEGRTWATMFGNDAAAAPFREYPALVQMRIDSGNRLLPMFPYPYQSSESMDILFVSPDGDATSGRSWNTAFHSLQDAVDAAQARTQIWIAGGIYSGSVRIKDHQALYVYGGFSGTERKMWDRNIKTHPVILNGGGMDSPVLRIENSKYIRIDGIEMTSGRVLGEKERGCGAGVYISCGGESIRFANCTIRDNYALKNGGGLYVAEGASPTFINCLFRNNEAQENGGGAYIECDHANGYHTRFYHSEFSYNKAQKNGGVAYMRTNLKQTGTLRFINCLIHDNFTLLEGGNIVLSGGATLLMSHCTVVGNRGMSKGTAIATLGRIPAQNRIVNSIFTNNYGAVLFTADAYEGADPTSSSSQNWTQLLHCLFYNNQTLGICGYTHNSDRFSDFSQINGNTWAEGNILADPLFVDPGNGDFRIQQGSPAVSSGTADNAFPYDFEGNARTIDYSNLTESVDIGFDEYEPHNRKRPNIIIILADDMGFSDLGCYGGEISTPNLDVLAYHGVRFSQFYNTARCCPTRASLLTGLHPHQAGVGYMTGKLGETTAYQGHLRKDRFIIAELLKQAGYTTLQVGKWHVGDEKTGSAPCDRGFDRGWSPWARVDYWNMERIYEDGVIRERSQGEMKYLTDVTGDKAIEYIDHAMKKEAPFFLYLAFNAAHWPLHAKADDIAKYRGKFMKGWDKLRLERIKRLEESGMVEGTDPDKVINPFVPRWNMIPEGDAFPGYHAMTSPEHDQDDWDAKMAVYAAQIDCMDQNIGRIVEKLRESGQLDNTLIMYLQDNGACAEHIGKNEAVYPGGPDSYTAYHLPWAYLSNTPFRMYKHFLHEGGISTPFIVHWPDGINRKRRGAIEKESFGQLVDLLPTCLEAAGTDAPEMDYALEGQSLIGVINNSEENAERQLYWEHEGNRCVRKGDWKLVSRYEDDVLFFERWEFPVERRAREWELYNVRDDRWEMNECASECPELVEELKNDYETFFKRVGARPRKEVIRGSKFGF